MAWSDDERLEEIYYEGITYGVSPADCLLIRRKLLILMAARGRVTLPVLGQIFSMPEGREAVQVTAGWSISFVWLDELGARAMQLEP